MKRVCIAMVQKHYSGPASMPLTKMLAAPTGTGKSVTMIEIQRALTELGYKTFIVTPSIEIIRGLLEKLGVNTHVSNGTLAKYGHKRGWFTPQKLANDVLNGKLEEPPQVILRDEAHEDALGNINTDLLMGTLGPVVSIGFTATPYRATPKSTKNLRDLYGEPIVALSIPDAVDRGYMALPKFEVAPVCNDDVVKIKGNDFQVSSIHKAYTNEIDILGRTIEDNWRWAPTIMSVSGSNLMQTIGNELRSRGIPYRIVMANTTGAERAKAYELAQSHGCVLLQIGVLTRGADLPKMRLLIDAQPTMSPVRWMQTVGRVCRPGAPSKVIVTNRNLARFAYLFDGLIPRESIVAEQQAFEAPCNRSYARTLGVEAIGKFKPCHLALLSGGFSTCYFVDSGNENGQFTTYGFMFFPGADRPLVAKQTRHFTDQVNEWGAKKLQYSSWTRCEMPSDLVGYSSVKKKPLTVNQLKFYNRGATRRGFSEPVEKMDSKKFQAFTMVNDLEKGG